MTARVSILLQLRASLTFIRPCFIPGRAKDLSQRRVIALPAELHWLLFTNETALKRGPNIRLIHVTTHILKHNCLSYTPFCSGTNTKYKIVGAKLQQQRTRLSCVCKLPSLKATN